MSICSKALTWKLKYVGLEQLVLSLPFHWILKVELIIVRLRFNWIKIALRLNFEYDPIDELYYLMASESMVFDINWSCSMLWY